MSEVIQCDGYPVVIELPSGNEIEVGFSDTHVDMDYRVSNGDGGTIPRATRQMLLAEEDQPPEGE